MSAAERTLFGIEKLNVQRSDIPAVTHVDYSSRIQTVHVDTNPRYYALISRFKVLTGCPILVNTSFNVRGEPIVCTPQDAFRCFMGTRTDGSRPNLASVLQEAQKIRVFTPVREPSGESRLKTILSTEIMCGKNGQYET
jgi:hypothetical protein